MTLDEALDESTTVTQWEAMGEVFKAAGLDEDERETLWRSFLQEVGDRQTYSGAEVLTWLGW